MKGINKIVIGVIGCGNMGKFHVKNITDNFPDVQIKYISDIDTAKVKSWLQTEVPYRNISLVPDYKEILEDKEVNTVIISTQITQHDDILIDSAIVGKNIFCEKQIGTNIKKVKKAIDLIEKKNFKLQVGFMKRFDKSLMKARDMILDGVIGDIHIVRTTGRNPKVLPPEYLKKDLYAGTFNELTSHEFDILRYLTGSEIIEVYSIGKVLIEPKFADINDYDTVVVSLKFENNAIGTIDNSFQANYGFDQRVEIFGTKGCIIVDNVTPTKIFLYNDRGGTTDKLASKTWPETPLFFVERYHEAYITEFKQFFDAIINDKNTNCTGMDGLKNILIARAAKKSADTNTPIKIDYSICS